MIEGLDAAAEIEGVEIFHAGTRPTAARITANGGRVLNVSALRQEREPGAGARLSGHRPDQWPEGFCRRDIGWQAVKRERAAEAGHIPCIPCFGSTRIPSAAARPRCNCRRWRG